MFRLTVDGKNFKEFKENLNQIHSAIMGGKMEVKEIELPSTTIEEAIAEVALAPVVETAPVVAETNHQVDSEGCPWDERLHASTKTQTAQGVWKKKRNLDNAILNAVRAEIMGTPVVETAPVVEAPAAMPAMVQPPLMNTGGHTLESFSQNLPMVVSSLITEGKVNQEYINQLKGYFGVAEIWQVNDQQKSEMFSTFVAAGLITQVA